VELRINMLTARSAARAKTIVTTLAAFPAFLIFAIIPWLIAIHAALLSRRFYEMGWSYLGVACKLFAIGLAVLTAVSTIWCFFVWLIAMFRVLRGLED
jgi:hypothetical protein